ncbi:MAG: NUDIX domain-containing protein [Clostridia bacterium]|nr:NUDIX domain-containing protein [Clostridia bacterium]
MKVETIDEIVHIYHDVYTGNISKRRVACRGILVDGNKILLSHEVMQGKYVLPGGGLEDGETLSECCEREVEEETGYIVKATEHIIEVREYDEDTLHESHIFACEVQSHGERHLTQHEVNINMTPEWKTIDEALAIFKGRADELGMYLREYTAINKYLNT